MNHRLCLYAKQRHWWKINARVHWPCACVLVVTGFWRIAPLWAGAGVYLAVEYISWFQPVWRWGFAVSFQICLFQTSYWFNLDTMMTSSLSGRSYSAHRSGGMGIFSTSSMYEAGSTKTCSNIRSCRSSKYLNVSGLVFTCLTVHCPFLPFGKFTLNSGRPVDVVACARPTFSL